MRDPNYSAELSESLADQLRLEDEQQIPAAQYTSSSNEQQAPTQYTLQSKRGMAPKQKKAMPRHSPGSDLMAEYEGTRRSTQGLAKLRDLEPTATLLLFTPVMVPCGFLEDYKTDTKQAQADSPASDASGSQSALLSSDPFEMLGVALSKQHRQVRHVPYVPSVGFTETHDTFLTTADAVIVVSATPEGRRDEEASITKQMDFASCVANALDEGERKVPMTNLSFGGNTWENQFVSYDHVFAGEKYNAEAVQNIVTLIFG